LTRISRKNNSSHSSHSWQKEGADLWALKDVSLEVERGEVVGVSGTGKSILRKILSRSTEPTGRKVKIQGALGNVAGIVLYDHDKAGGASL